MRSALVAVCVAGAVGCSLIPPKGVSITDIDQTSSLGNIGADRVRLELSDYSDGTKTRSEQVILDFIARTLERHDDTMEWQPTLTGYVTDSAVGAVVVGSGLNVTWPGGQPMLLALPNVAFAWWWYSAALSRIFIVYQESTFSSNHMVAACTSTGVCVQGASFSASLLQNGRSAEVWDEERLVALPLACCVCVSAEYYTFELADDGRPVLISVPPLATLGPVWYDTASNEVWTSPMQYTGYGALEVIRYNYGSHTTASVEIPPSEVEAVFGGGGGLPGWAIALIVLGAVGGLVVVAAVVAKGRGKRREDPKMSGVMASTPAA